MQTNIIYCAPILPQVQFFQGTSLVLSSAIATSYYILFNPNTLNFLPNNSINFGQNCLSNQQKPFHSQSKMFYNDQEQESKNISKIQNIEGFANVNEDNQQFQLTNKNKNNGVVYKKKNTESNIVNQTLSFVNTERSLPFLSFCLQGNEDKIQSFYKVLTMVKKGNKKYVNRKYLKRLIEFAERSQFHRAYLKLKQKVFTLIQLRATLRKLIFYFLRGYSRLSLLTSSKICKQNLYQNLWRKRQITDFLFAGEQKKGEAQI